MTDPSSALMPTSDAQDLPIITITDFLIHQQFQSPLNEPLNFSATPGQLIAMTGKSGVGKTQFMLSVLHALPTNWYISGHIDVCGQDPTKLTGLELQNFRKNIVSYLGQDPGSDLNPFQRVSTILGLGSPIHTLLNRSARRQRFTMPIGRYNSDSTANNNYDPGSTANNNYDPGNTANNNYDQQHHYSNNWLIHELEIASLLRLLPSHLSGGQQRRVALAKTLSKKTPLILLDEPFAGQDPRLQLKLAQILQKWAQCYNLVIIFTTHNEEWIEIADKHVCINSYTSINNDQQHSPTDNPHTIYPNALADHISPATPADSNYNNHSDLYPQQLAPANTAELTPLVQISHLLLKNSSVTNAPAFSLTIANGEAIALIGPSGSGKTSLAHGIIGRDAISGTITIAGQQLPLHLLDRSPAERQLIELIPQNPLACLNPSHTIGRILNRAYRHSYASPKPTNSTVAQGLARVGLSPDIAHRYPHELSGGQRQRICVARALAYRPKLLICDEITSALDSVNAQEINALLWDILAEEEIALLYITHHIEQVITRCSRVITL